jgi:hypothetical protein
MRLSFIDVVIVTFHHLKGIDALLFVGEHRQQGHLLSGLNLKKNLWR